MSSTIFRNETRPIDVRQRHVTVTMRRDFIGSMLAGAIATTGGSRLLAQTDNDADWSRLYVPDEVDNAVSEAVDYLVNRQGQNGSIADRQNEVAMTSLAIMAMASVGVQPDRQTDRGKAMTRAMEFVLKPDNQDANGYFGRRDRSQMYGHGIITLMLTEMLGMGIDVDQNVRMHKALEQAIGLILQAQKVKKRSSMQGGWRYAPDSTDSDLSVSIWQLMALRSANNDGMHVPGEAIDQAVSYLVQSSTAQRLPDGRISDAAAGFSYMPGSRSGTFAMTAAGLLAMQVCGRYESPVVTAAAKWLLEHPPRTNERFFFYGIYYYAQAMYQVGDTYADTARRLTSAILLKDQRGDGSWHGYRSEERNIGPIYTTALAVLSLSVRYHYLPIYQR
ncbi:hypothetical protein V7x_19510 [Crateriforma conspicua]|uniref:Prenyltransferase and squalene oxidase repeat protein n=1 Tax=Crateriforma conspicua TaxID=2527996 RepID=A0A5C6FXM6_9PLAN|nr:hypothetical protein V7x_19510 [Crateriforma conspicua]